MARSLRVASLFGIELRIHATFFILPILVGVLHLREAGWEAGLRAAVLVLALFVCVLGHELSHSLVALRYGVPVPQITLYFMGGVASMHRIPKDPSKEFWIAIAGPCFNFVLAALLYPILVFLIGERTIMRPTLETWSGTAANLFWLNPVLGAFNLIPAFPMDGGRILRSFLARRMNYVLATRISVHLGHVFAILFLLLGLWQRQWMLVFIAFFVFTSATDEMRAVERGIWIQAHNGPSK